MIGTKHFPWEKTHSPGKGFYTAKYAWKSVTEVEGCKQNLTGLMNVCQSLLLISVKSFSKSDLHCTRLRYYRAVAKRNKYFMLGEKNTSNFYILFCSAPSREISSLLTLLVVPRCHLWEVSVVITFHFQIEDLAFWLRGIDNKVFIQEFLRNETPLFLIPQVIKIMPETIQYNYKYELLQH